MLIGNNCLPFPHSLPVTTASTLRTSQLLDQLQLDYRAEVVAAGLLADSPLTLEQLIFRPLGLTTRPYSKDAPPAQELVAGSGAYYLQLDTPREGLYDQLPPLLFHTEPPNAGYIDADAAAARRRQDREIEQQARRFFLPFDTELYYLRLLRYQHELEQPVAGLLPLDELAAVWPIVRQLGPAAGLFIQVLPYIHQLRNNRPWISEFLSIVSGVPVRFEAGAPLVYEVPPQPSQQLGQCHLGSEAVLGSTFRDGNLALHLCLGPVPPSRVAEFVPTRPLRKLLAALLDYFLPATTVVEVLVETESSPPAGAPTAPPISYLGYMNLGHTSHTLPAAASVASA